MFSRISNQKEKVFGIGLSRTGTRSLAKALETLGYHALHWRFAPENRLLELEDAYFCDAIVDIPAAFMFETLFHVFPKSKFVYTTRPLDDWERSISAHYDADTPRILGRRLELIPVSPRPVGQSALISSPLYHAIHHSIYTQHETWRAAYAAHDARIRKFFAGQEYRLLNLDVFAGNEGWPELCSFLGAKTPSSPYPRVDWKNNPSYT